MRAMVSSQKKGYEFLKSICSGWEFVLELFNFEKV